MYEYTPMLDKNSIKSPFTALVHDSFFKNSKLYFAFKYGSKIKYWLHRKYKPQRKINLAANKTKQARTTKKLKIKLSISLCD